MNPIWKGIHFSVFQEGVSTNVGGTKTFEFVWRIDGTRTIVTDAKGFILLTREYRHELDGYDWRLPGGKLDFVDEEVQVAAARELREETGIEADTWRYLWSTTPDATVRFKRHFLAASGVHQFRQELDDGEDISVHWFSSSQVAKMALDGEIREEISALSLLRFINLA